MQCPECSAEVPEDDLFCENCGLRLHAAKAEPPAAEACTCGASPGEVDEEGFCLQCGRRVRRPASDHIEQVVSAQFAAVCDRGVRHDRNEDRCGIVQIADGFGMVVCDGVSSSRRSEIASTTVAQGVTAALTTALATGTLTDAEAVVRQAIAAGQANLLARMAEAKAGDNPPSTTVVAAVVTAGKVTVGWVGDSRAYWIGQNAASLLTRDHSWANAVVAAGEMTAEQAEASPQAHAITRWIGADAGENAAVEVIERALPGSGTLLLCTDGLWNYAPSPDVLLSVMQTAGAGDADAVTTARRLVEFATAKGGHDNITAIVLRME